MTTPAENMTDAAGLQDRIVRFQKAQEAIVSQVRRVIVGQEEVIDQVMVALFVGGHCLKVRCRCGRSYGVASLTQRFSSIVETGSCVAVAAKLIAPALKTFAPAAVS